MSRPADLTAAQWAAVDHIQGPLLVLAGPGSGKTRVITRRIVRLVDCGIQPEEILAITFTNKASREMAERVDALMPGTRVWVSTFHRFCASLLRRYARVVGLDHNFTIYDQSDQRQLVKDVFETVEFAAAKLTPGAALQQISRKKQHLIDPEVALQKAEAGGSFEEIASAKIFAAYQRSLLASNAVDFDDLLCHTATLLNESEQIRQTLGQQYRYILVDEYQDTNTVQYQILKALASEHKNVCVTGDPDQSIYGWRGADIANILRFERDFPGTLVVRLEQNYRSTQALLRGADTLIRHNTRRKEKRLFSENPEGLPAELLTFPHEVAEAEGIALLITRLCGALSLTYNDFAIIYRVNALSRLLETSVMKHGVPYQVAHGLAFYEREEIKNVLAYMRLILNPSDDAAFKRVVNVPTRGLGDKSIAKLMQKADEWKVPLLTAARQADDLGLSEKARSSLVRFVRLIDSLSSPNYEGVSGILSAVLEQSGYQEELRNENTDEARGRLENVEELRTAAQEHDRSHGDQASLESFLEQSSLVSDVDAVETQSGKVTLMTMHAAKGLEYPVVFIVGLEQGLIPHERSLGDTSDNNEEEERRLLFVGMTRAMQRLFLTRVDRRTFRGRSGTTINSPFQRDLGSTIDQSNRLVLELIAAQPDLVQRWDAEAWRQRGTAPHDAAPQNDHREKLRERIAAASGKPLLTTAAQLLGDNPEPVQLLTNFTVGMSVRHPRYGLGKVVEVEGAGKNRTVTVEFAPGDQKSFRALQCPLQPVGIG